MRSRKVIMYVCNNTILYYYVIKFEGFGHFFFYFLYEHTKFTTISYYFVNFYHILKKKNSSEYSFSFSFELKMVDDRRSQSPSIYFPFITHSNEAEINNRRSQSHPSIFSHFKKHSNDAKLNNFNQKSVSSNKRPCGYDKQ